MSLSFSHPCCGLFQVKNTILAALVDAEGRCLRLNPSLDDHSMFYDWIIFLEHEHGLDVEMVLPFSLVQKPWVNLALSRQIVVWLVPDRLLRGICHVTRTRTRPLDIAFTLARMPGCLLWRPYLLYIRSSNLSSS